MEHAATKSQSVRTPCFRMFGNFLQFGYVTTDMDKALGQLGRDWDVTQFYQRRDFEFGSHRAVRSRLSVAMAFVGDTMIEVIEPRGGADGLFRDWLPRNEFGLRLHHLGYLIRHEADWEKLVANTADSGIDLAMPMQQTPVARTLYLDTAGRLGHYVEYLLLSAAGRDLFASVPRN